MIDKRPRIKQIRRIIIDNGLSGLHGCGEPGMRMGILGSLRRGSHVMAILG